MLSPLQIPPFAERILGITIPDDSTLFACSYDGLHTIELGDPTHVETDEDGIEDYKLLQSKGPVLGILGGDPILEVGDTKITYTFNDSSRVQRVEVQIGDATQTVEFNTMSGDWFYATLSTSGKYLVLAEPYRLDAYVVA
jgi:hypothetical protein